MVEKLLLKLKRLFTIRKEKEISLGYRNLYPTLLESSPTGIIQTKAYEDEQLLIKIKREWNTASWNCLAQVRVEEFKHHPERAHIALLVAVGNMQNGELDKSYGLLQCARQWGATEKIIAPMLVSGVYQTLGRATALLHHQEKSAAHFKYAKSIGFQDINKEELISFRDKGN